MVGLDEEAARTKKQDLLARLEKLRGLVVAFSGGVDSSLLLATAREALGKDVIAATARSPIHSPSETDEAVRTAQALGVRYILFQSQETELEAFTVNRRDRCYHCKRNLFAQLFQIAAREGFHHVAHGANLDDRQDYRPGLRAAQEAGGVAPLMEVGLNKEEIRFLSKEMGLASWDRPSTACLATRIAYGSSITPDKIRMVEETEGFLGSRGFRVARVRHYGSIARIEVPVSDLERIMEKRAREEIVVYFRSKGFQHVVLDLEGYITGKMNRDLEV